MAIKKTLILILAAMIMMLATPAEAAKKRPQMKQYNIVQSKYSSAIRWSEFEMAWSYVDPAYRSANPLSDLETQRFKQIQVTGYEEKSQDVLADGNIELRVEIRLINRNTQAERIIIDTQLWRWDPAAKRWWLTTGLPNFTAR